MSMQADGKVLVNSNELNTRAKILRAAKEEFFEKGFMNSSVRSIAERIDLTTGALYNIFKNKEDIFNTIVEGVFDKFMDLAKHNATPEECGYSMKTSDLSAIMEVSRSRFLSMIDFFFDNWDAMKLIVCCSQGSSYEHIFDRAIEFAENETIYWLKYDGIEITKRIQFFIHVMVSSHFENLKEIFYHGLTKEEAIQYAMDFNTYHCAGWKQYWMENVEH